RKHGMVEHRDEHGGHAMQHRAALPVDGGQCHQRVEPLHHHLGAAVCEAAHGGQHHTETVEQWHTDTAFIIRRKLHVHTGKVTVVDDVVVGEHHPFGKTCRPGGVLHVDHVVAAGKRTQSPELVVRHALPQQQHLGGVVHAAVLLLSDVDHILQSR